MSLPYAEIDDTRRGLARAKNAGNYVPMKLFRGWGNRVLSVTDLAAGLWCQVQVEYRYLHPHLRTTTEWVEMEQKGTPVVRKTEGMKKGCAVHLKKGEVCCAGWVKRLCLCVRVCLYLSLGLCICLCLFPVCSSLSIFVQHSNQTIPTPNHLSVIFLYLAYSYFNI